MDGTWSGGARSERGGEPDDLGPEASAVGLGSRRLAELTADEVDRWLARESGQVSTDTLAKLLSILMTSLEGFRAPARADLDAPARLTYLHRDAP
jgi:hypothetical protein